ncbi:MAG: B12-binding domain-containing radical SAM protein [Lachnospiraceae bacterium]
MNIILVAINAKYIHSNLAVYSLKKYADVYGEKNCDIAIAEYTINQQIDEILMDLYKKKPEIICFSCYIWNLMYVEELVKEIGKVLPDTAIWLGGPEVSYDSEQVLARLPALTGVMIGEGEATFLELLSAYQDEKYYDFSEIKGLSYYTEKGQIVTTPFREVMDLSTIPFVYEDMKSFEHKIIYYETSRGCPFSCSYCLSSVEKKLRFRSMELVKKELQFFLDQQVEQVKFVDRTFNCSHERTIEIWNYLNAHDNGITNFHFEIAADLLKQKEIDLIRGMRPGFIQLEIGVQSTNLQTIQAIRRTMNFSKVKSVVEAIHKIGNVHQHLDLIAGLPYEGYQSFGQSFNDVYSLHPEQLQLGFLKVLKGSYMEQQKKTYGLIYKNHPPYEVLFTNWLSYEEMIKLKRIEEVVEVYYNSGQFQKTLELLETVFSTPFQFYESLSNYYEENAWFQMGHSRVTRYEILLEFTKIVDNERTAIYKELLTYDLYLRENMKTRPQFAGEHNISKEELQLFYDREEKEHLYLKGYDGFDKRQLRKMTHVERFVSSEKTILFDYKNRNPLTNQAATFLLS